MARIARNTLVDISRAADGMLHDLNLDRCTCWGPGPVAAPRPCGVHCLADSTNPTVDAYKRAYYGLTGRHATEAQAEAWAAAWTARCG